MRRDMRPLASFVAFGLAGLASAQVPAIIPYPRTQDLFVVDSTFDGVWRLSDQNQDGDYNDPGEVTVFYSDLTPGGIALTNPSCVVAAPDGTVYVADTTNDIVLALRDQNGDGDANDPGEFRVFFTSITNASGITMASAQGITIDAIGRLFLAVANAGTVGQDMILKLQDLDGDGDADDLGEASVYCLIPTGAGAVGNSIPTKVVAAADGNLYYTDVASTTATTKGVYKLEDLDHNGDCNGPGEVSLFWTPPFTASPFYWSLAVDANMNFYVTDHSTNRTVYRGRDADHSGTISAAETTVFFTEASATWWDVVLRDDGVVLLVNASTPDRLTACVDLNNDGDALDPGESSLAYASGTSPTAISVRGAAFQRAPIFDPIAPTALGQTALFNLHGTKPGDLCVSIFALGFGPPIALPPWGIVEIDVNSYLIYGIGIADATATFAHTLAIPSTPSVVGTYAFQGWCGDLFRLYFSNAVPFTIQ
ncbi:MAG: hypothetical protein QM775_24880 [Pirellulales bacterium]